jgi:cytochrome c oxidase subunit 2
MLRELLSPFDFIMLLISNLLTFMSPLSCDSSYPWQIWFQDGSTPNFEGIVELHDTIFFYLVVVSFLVFWMLAVIIFRFSSSKVGIAHKYQNHGTMIELIWTITPALILIAIAFPSFKLLYLMDSTTITYMLSLQLNFSTGLRPVSN